MTHSMPPAVDAALRRAIQLLTGGLSAADASANWTDEARRTFLDWLRELQMRAAQGESIEDHTTSIIRNLDVWGIQSGRLHDAVLAVQTAWRS